MIEIIEKGNEKFIMICPTCGCKFSYSIDDFITGSISKTVKCPCCSQILYHIDRVKEYFPLTRDKTSEYEKLQEWLRRQLNSAGIVAVPYENTNPCNNCSFYREYIIHFQFFL